MLFYNSIWLVLTSSQTQKFEILDPFTWQKVLIWDLLFRTLYSLVSQSLCHTISYDVIRLDILNVSQGFIFFRIRISQNQNQHLLKLPWQKQLNIWKAHEKWLWTKQGHFLLLCLLQAYISYEKWLNFSKKKTDPLKGYQDHA